MFIINESLFTKAGDIADAGSKGRRFHRGRNNLSGAVLDWGAQANIPSDPPYWVDLFDSSVRIGVIAAKKTMKPALLVWGLMAGIAASYYFVPASHGLFAGLIAVQKWMGVLFPSLGMGLSVGLLVEGVKVAVSKNKHWTRENTINALFNFAVFGMMGVTQYYRYAFQENFFGTGTSWRVLMPKVMFDQFVWTVFFANPYQCILYLWRNKGFSWKRVGSEVFPFKAFWGTRMLPVLISNWAFWIPMASIVYCFPSELQVPLAILAVSMWVMLLSVLTQKE
jgi:hypothetical protein